MIHPHPLMKTPVVVTGVFIASIKAAISYFDASPDDVPGETIMVMIVCR